MATNVIFTRGNTATINATAITDGQILYNTTAGTQYLDNGTTRIQVGQNITVDTTLNSLSNNPIANRGVAGVMMSSLSEISTVTQAGSLPDALAVKELNSNMSGLAFAQNADGKWGYKVAGADPVIPFSKRMELLWTNPSPSSAFVAQTVSLDLSKYKYVEIECQYANLTYLYKSITLQPVPSQTSGNGNVTPIVTAVLDSGHITSRPVTINTSEVIFSTGYASTVAGTTYCIPLKIYGYAEELA